MKTRFDLDRQISSWLEAEAPDRAPERLLASSRDRLRTTAQRRFGVARRFVEMNAFFRLSVAAAVVVVAVIAVGQLPSGVTSTSGGSASPSVSASSTGSNAVGERSPWVSADLSSAVELSTGVHYLTLEMLSFTVPTSGWTYTYNDEIKKVSSFAALEQGERPTASITFRQDSPDGVYADPCKHVRRDPVGRATETDEWPDRLQHSADLAAALATIPGTNLVDGPSDVTVGELPAQYVALSVREDIACAGSFYVWYDWDRPSRSAPPGETIRTWIVDYLRFRMRFWIEAKTPGDPTPELGEEIQQIVDSIQFAG